jgi:hypothetical protein
MADNRGENPLDTRDCRAAIDLAERVLAGHVPEDGPFKLIGLVNLIKGAEPPGGLAVWQLTFKPASLLPAIAEGKVGAGGEWIVRVDLGRTDNPISMKRED